MKIFLGGSFNNRGFLRMQRVELQRLGHTVLASWLDSATFSNTDARLFQAQATLDAWELAKADLALIDVREPSSSGGFESEVGMALAYPKPLWIIGPPRNIYHYQADVIIKDWPTAFDLLARE